MKSKNSKTTKKLGNKTKSKLKKKILKKKVTKKVEPKAVEKKLHKLSITRAAYMLFETLGEAEVKVPMFNVLAKSIKPNSKTNKWHLYFHRRNYRAMMLNHEAPKYKGGEKAFIDKFINNYNEIEELDKTPKKKKVLKKKKIINKKSKKSKKKVIV